MSEQYDKLGFLSMNSTESNDGYLGALLVTDSSGIPLEFRATHPIKPTPIQRTLYGEALEPYVGVMLCGRQLVRASDQRPDIVFVNREFMLDLREDVTVPVVYGREAGQAVQLTGDEAIRRPQTRIDPLVAGYKPVMIYVHGLDADIFDEVRNRLEKLTGQLDILEPFSRIEEALKVLAKQDKRFQ